MIVETASPATMEMPGSSAKGTNMPLSGNNATFDLPLNGYGKQFSRDDAGSLHALHDNHVDA